MTEGRRRDAATVGTGLTMVGGGAALRHAALDRAYSGQKRPRMWQERKFLHAKPGRRLFGAGLLSATVGAPAVVRGTNRLLTPKSDLDKRDGNRPSLLREGLGGVKDTLKERADTTTHPAPVKLQAANYAGGLGLGSATGSLAHLALRKKKIPGGAKAALAASTAALTFGATLPAQSKVMEHLSHGKYETTATGVRRKRFMAKRPSSAASVVDGRPGRSNMHPAALRAAMGPVDKRKQHTRESFAQTYQPGLHKIPRGHLVAIRDGQERKAQRVAAVQDSVRRHGIKTPLAVRTHGGKAYLVNGHHRLDTANNLRMRHVPVEVKEGGWYNASDQWDSFNGDFGRRLHKPTVAKAFGSTRTIQSASNSFTANLKRMLAAERGDHVPAINSIHRDVPTDMASRVPKEIKGSRLRYLREHPRISGVAFPNGRGGGEIHYPGHEPKPSTMRHEQAHLAPKRNPYTFKTRIQDPVRRGREEGRADYITNGKASLPGFRHGGNRDAQFKSGYTEVQRKMRIAHHGERRGVKRLLFGKALPKTRVRKYVGEGMPTAHKRALVMGAGQIPLVPFAGDIASASTAAHLAPPELRKKTAALQLGGTQAGGTAGGALAAYGAVAASKHPSVIAGAKGMSNAAGRHSNAMRRATAPKRAMDRGAASLRSKLGMKPRNPNNPLVRVAEHARTPRLVKGALKPLMHNPKLALAAGVAGSTVGGQAGGYAGYGHALKLEKERNVAGPNKHGVGKRFVPATDENKKQAKKKSIHAALSTIGGAAGVSALGTSVLSRHPRMHALGRATQPLLTVGAGTGGTGALLYSGIERKEAHQLRSPVNVVPSHKTVQSKAYTTPHIRVSTIRRRLTGGATRYSRSSGGLVR